MLAESPEEDGAYTNGYYHADEEEEMQDDENWEQVGPKKKSVLTRRVGDLSFFSSQEH